MRIYIHNASDRLTDHDAHGEGLIVFSLAEGLAKRGHTITAYSESPAVDTLHPNLQIVSDGPAKHPVHSLRRWQLSHKSNRYFEQHSHEFDLVWRAYPFREDCPILPRTGGIPLVVGPVNTAFPDAAETRPRFLISGRNIIKPLAMRGWRRTLRRANLVFTETRTQMNDLERLVADDRIASLPHIIERPASFAQQDSKTGSTNILLVGSLTPVKRPLFFCHLVGELIDSGYDVRATIVGDGPLRGDIESWRDFNGLTDAIELVGKRARSEVFDLMGKSDLLLSPALGEPYGLAIAEAMAHGLTVVCHASGGPADYITSGQDGVLVEGSDLTTWKRQVADLIQNPSVRRSIGANARKRSDEWNQTRVIDKFESMLQSLI